MELIIPNEKMYFAGFPKQLHFYPGKRFYSREHKPTGIEFVTVDRFVNDDIFIKREFCSQMMGMWELYNYSTGEIKRYSVNPGDGEETDIIFPAKDFGRDGLERYIAILKKIKYYCGVMVKEHNVGELIEHEEYLQFIIDQLS